MHGVAHALHHSVLPSQQPLSSFSSVAAPTPLHLLHLHLLHLLVFFFVASQLSSSPFRTPLLPLLLLLPPPLPPSSSSACISSHSPTSPTYSSHHHLVLLLLLSLLSPDSSSASMHHHPPSLQALSFSHTRTSLSLPPLKTNSRTHSLVFVQLRTYKQAQMSSHLHFSRVSYLSLSLSCWILSKSSRSLAGF